MMRTLRGWIVEEKSSSRDETKHEIYYVCLTRKYFSFLGSVSHRPTAASSLNFYDDSVTPPLLSVGTRKGENHRLDGGGWIAQIRINEQFYFWQKSTENKPTMLYF